jgi:hypothetical protein
MPWIARFQFRLRFLPGRLCLRRDQPLLAVYPMFGARQRQDSAVFLSFSRLAPSATQCQTSEVVNLAGDVCTA